MNVTSRFSEYIKYKNILQKDVSDILKISSQAVSGIFKEKSKLTTDHLIILAERFPELNLRWLLTGAGVMLMTPKNYNENEARNQVEDYGPVCKSCLEKEKRIADKDQTIEAQKRHIDFLEFSLGKKIATSK